MKKIILTIFIIICGCASNAVLTDSNIKRPNILIIMADDLGYSDIGCYGGEIATPTIDSLAKNGLRFSHFYNASRCCPTRASLLTGCYPHKVGLRFNGRSLSSKVKTIAEILKAEGYQTGMTGKWHLSQTAPRRNRDEQLKWLSHQADYGHFAPLSTYPCNRGFDEHYGVIWGVVNYFDPFSLVHNEEPIKTVKDDFYITDFINDKAIDLIGQFSKKDAPFLLYIAHTAPHWPLHAKPKDIEKYKNHYHKGWEVLQKKRYEAVIEQGVINRKNTPLPPLSGNKRWNDLTDKERQYEANIMAIHAAMVDSMDQGIARVVEALKRHNFYDNTLIFFLSDNGASPERGYGPGFDRNGHTRQGDVVDYKATTNLGSERTYPYLGSNWASACNTPYRYWKIESYDGGNRSPLIVHWPQAIKVKKGSVVPRLSHVIDIFPTILEVAQCQQGQTVKVDGISLLPILLDKQGSEHKALYFEHSGGKAVRTPDWKLVALGKKREWKLYNVSRDASETQDVAEKNPEIFNKMKSEWKAWFKSVNN